MFEMMEHFTMLCSKMPLAHTQTLENHYLTTFGPLPPSSLTHPLRSLLGPSPALAHDGLDDDDAEFCQGPHKSTTKTWAKTGCATQSGPNFQSLTAPNKLDCVCVSVRTSDPFRLARWLSSNCKAVPMNEAFDNQGVCYSAGR